MVVCIGMLFLIFSVTAYAIEAQPHGMTSHMESSGHRDHVQTEYQETTMRISQANFPKPVSTYPERNLQPGNVLTITQKTPLLPELYPNNPQESMAGIRTIYPGSTILVKQVVIKGRTPWYEVDVSFKGRGVIATGWINSVALADQFETIR